MTSRPAIPKEVVLAVLLEAGHRCAVCGTPFPLERAHIVPWRETQDHSAENLICLCANCHERADKDWDTRTLRAYKKQPWVLRQHGRDDRRTTDSAAVEITVDGMELSGFDQKQRQWLVFGLAAFLRVDPEQVTLRGVMPGSVKVVVTVPASKTEVLHVAHKEHPDLIRGYFEPMDIIDVKVLDMRDRECPELDSVAIREILIGFLAVDDDLVRTLIATAPAGASASEYADHILEELRRRGHALTPSLSQAIEEAVSGASVECPRCLGKGVVEQSDVERLRMHHRWGVGFCLYCYGAGSVPSYLPQVHGVTSPPP